MLKRALTLFAAATLSVGCGGSTVANQQPTPPTQTQFRQVEQLARPGINEALLFTNNFLNTYNAVSPAFIRAALANANSAEGIAAAPVLAEATAVLNILTNLDPNNGPTTAQVIIAFLPDVMRIDTTLNIAVGGVAYNSAVNVNGSLVGGRKLLDDVVDITLDTLTGGVVTTDNVPYYPNANPGIGHQNLNGQAAANGPATFPFLAPPN